MCGRFLASKSSDEVARWFATRNATPNSRSHYNVASYAGHPRCAVPAPAPRLHPKLADIYGEKVENLRHALNTESTRAEASQALRPLIEAIRLVPENGRLDIELTGDLAGILALASESKALRTRIPRIARVTA